MPGVLDEAGLVVGHPAEQDELELEWAKRGDGHGINVSTQDPHVSGFLCCPIGT